MNTLNNVISDETLVRMLSNYQPKYYHKTFNFLNVVSTIYRPSKINLELDKRLATLAIIEDDTLTNTYGIYNHTNNLIRIRPDAPIGIFEDLLLTLYVYNKQARTSGFACGIGQCLSNKSGMAINEFTRQYIMHKYFDAQTFYNDFNDSVVSRIINIIYIENFVNSYFDGGLEKLYLYLQYYSNTDLARQLIDSLDKYYYILGKCEKDSDSYSREVSNSKMCINKILCAMEQFNKETINNLNTTVYTLKN